MEVSTTSSQRPLRAILATSIVEVGVDVQRLSLLTILGQPKNTSQYIQVSSRIGRNRNAPGLVVVQLNPSKPRDRSHYEGFRSFHERFYAQVEPTSVTPFSPPSTERTLHALITAVVRQMGKQKESSKTPRPFPLDENSNLYKKIRTMFVITSILSIPPASYIIHVTPK